MSLDIQTSEPTQPAPLMPQDAPPMPQIEYQPLWAKRPFAPTFAAPAVYRAIANVSAELAKVGIAKTRRNTQGDGYNFRGIDEVLNALAPALAKHGLIVLPRFLSRAVSERTSRSGGAIFCVVVDAEFDFVAVADGSKHTVKMFGEAMDSGDKATNKAMSAAYKYAAFQAFCIPLEGMAADADTQTHEVAAQPPAGYAAWLDDFKTTALDGSKAIAAAWKATPEPIRAWAQQQDADALKAVKETAATATAAAKEPTA